MAVAIAGYLYSINLQYGTAARNGVSLFANNIIAKIDTRNDNN